MSKKLIVGTEEFDFPEQGDNSGWGESATDWAEAVSEALTTVQQRNDIPSSTAAILNNATSFTPIPGFSFDTSEVISINCEFIITRSTAAPAVNLVESGLLQGNFDGSVWSITIESIGTSGVELDINSSGQCVYKSSQLVGSAYAGQILFKAKVFNQPE